jgi:quinol monooxygenase YgiN
MSYVVAATYVVREGETEAVRDALEAMVPLTRAEAACLEYRAHQSVEDPSVFFLYEEYVDEGGFKAHAQSAHFERYIKGEAWPRLESRTVVRAQPL